MKALFALALLLFCCSAAQADGIDTFFVNEQTQFGTIPLSNAPPTDFVDWIIVGPTNGSPPDNFFADLPLLFELLGIAVPFEGPKIESIIRLACYPSCQEWRFEAIYPTDLPPGINVSSTVTVPTQTPEPASLLLFGSGLLGLQVLRRSHIWQRMLH